MLAKFINYNYGLCNSPKFTEIFIAIREAYAEGFSPEEIYNKKVRVIDPIISFPEFEKYYKYLIRENKKEEVRAKGEDMANIIASSAMSKLSKRIESIDPDELRAEKAIELSFKAAKVLQDSELITMKKKEMERDANARMKVIDAAVFGELEEEDIKQLDNGTQSKGSPGK